jgi:hypothetical protein
MKKMRIRIKRDGKTEIRVEGAVGDECLGFTRSVEHALGEIESRERYADEGDSLSVEAEEQVTENETTGGF